MAPLAEGLDADTILRIAKRAVGAGGRNERLLCAASYRAGRFRDALTNYTLAVQHGHRPRGWDLLFHAMTLHRLNESAEARAVLTRARDWVTEADRVEDTPTEAGEVRWFHWMERVEVHALLREAEALIGS